jgi:hypothetical protein
MLSTGQRGPDDASICMAVYTQGLYVQIPELCVWTEHHPHVRGDLKMPESCIVCTKDKGQSTSLRGVGNARSCTVYEGHFTSQRQAEDASSQKTLKDIPQVRGAEIASSCMVCSKTIPRSQKHIISLGSKHGAGSVARVRDLMNILYARAC